MLFHRFVVVVTFLLAVVLWWMIRSPWGRAFTALRENPIRAASLGIDTRMYTLLAFAIGIATAMTWNFFWNRRVTFADAVPSPFWRQYLGFCASCSLGALISWGTRTLLRRQFPVFDQQIVLAVPFGVVAGMMFNYLLCRRWVFRTTRRDEESSSRESNTPPR